MSEDSQTYSATAESGNVYERRSRWTKIKLAARKSPYTARFGVTVIVFYVLVALLAPVFAPYGEAQVFPAPYEPWSATHIFGTDQIGRDIFSRMIYGARNTVGIAVATTLLSFLIGGSLGLAAAIDRRWIDQVLSRSVDVLMAIPSLIFALVLLSIFGSTVLNLIMIIAVLDATRVFRLTRSVAVNVVVMDYVEAAKLRGEGLGLGHAARNSAEYPAAADCRVRSAFLFCLPDNRGAVLPWCRHSATDRRLGIDGA
jgi:peptide/nickel transport system permease protein